MQHMILNCDVELLWKDRFMHDVDVSIDGMGLATISEKDKTTLLITHIGNIAITRSEEEK